MTSTITAAISRLLPEFLPRQRWFGSKAKRIERCDVDDLAQLAERCYWLLAAVWLEDGTKERYALLVRHTSGSSGLPLLGAVDAPDRGFLVEAAGDPDSVISLLAGFRARGDMTTLHGGTLRYGDRGPGAAPESLTASSAIHPLAAEQSNTSLRIGTSLVFKLFRRLQDGENPELEITRFLTTRTTFRDISILGGSLSYQSPDGGISTVGVLQRWVDNDGNGWEYALSALRDLRSANPAEAGHHDLYAETETPLRRLIADLTQLGSITVRLHAALASDPSVEAFRPEAVDESHVEVWKRHLLERIAGVQNLLADRADSLPTHVQPIAAAVVEGRDRLSALVAADRRSGFLRIRIHGDYHLGQTLKTRDGFVVIDFEGEPATPLAERRLKKCALKDVAGMLRSIDYAIDVAYSGDPDPAHRRRLAGALREAFLEGYFRDPATPGAAWLPADTRSLEAWLQFFELEKALYEVEYELNNRPGWAHIPLRAVARALDVNGPQPPEPTTA